MNPYVIFAVFSFTFASIFGQKSTLKPIHVRLSFDKGGNIKYFKKGDKVYYSEIDHDSRYDARTLDYLFGEFKLLFNKTYKTDVEAKYRLRVFSANLDRINKLQDNELGSAKYGVTRFADLTEKEFVALFTGYKPTGKPRNYFSDPLEGPTVEQIDWRSLGAVTNVKNQGNCGSCWAFSTTGNIEGVWKVRKGALVSLSEQQLVDCDTVDQGCQGGEMSDAYKAIEKMGGLETETDYPYHGRRSNACQLNRTEVRVYINDSVALPVGNETYMAAWVAQRGPTAVALNASPLMFYFGGVVHPYRLFCNPKHLNHGVLLVGFGVERTSKKTTPYWIVKNSWGSSWGEKGYFRLFRGQGVCGIDQDATSVLID